MKLFGLNNHSLCASVVKIKSQFTTEAQRRRVKKYTIILPLGFCFNSKGTHVDIDDFYGSARIQCFAAD